MEVDLKTDKDFAVLGYFGGKLAGKDVPVFEGDQAPSHSGSSSRRLVRPWPRQAAVALYMWSASRREAPTKQDVIGDEIQPVVFDQAAYDKVCEKIQPEGPHRFRGLG